MANEPPRRRVRELAWTLQGSAGDAQTLRTVRSLTTADIGVVFQPIVSLVDGAVFA